MDKVLLPVAPIIVHPGMGPFDRLRALSWIRIPEPVTSTARG
jgi:hypothetical protein